MEILSAEIYLTIYVNNTSGLLIIPDEEILSVLVLKFRKDLIEEIDKYEDKVN
jgi:hypothetical protein